MMNLKKNLLMLTVALFSLGFVACSDNDEVDAILPQNTSGTWALLESSAVVKSDNQETVDAIEAELGRSTFSLKYIKLNEDGSYESTLNSFDKGTYKLENDVLHLIKAEPYNSTTPSTQSFDVVFEGVDKMKLTEDITSRFTEKYDDVEKVTTTHSVNREITE